VGWSKTTSAGATYSMRGYFRGDWKAVDKKLRASYLQQRLDIYIPPGLKRAAKAAEAEIQRAIRGRRYIANAPLTTGIKGSSNPLVDTDAMAASVTRRVEDWNVVWVGVPSGNTSSGADRTSIALALHRGERIRVTQKMRAMFVALSRVSDKKMSPGRLRGRAAALYAKNPSFQWRPIRRRKRFLRIPKRPFMQRAFMSGRTRKAFVAELRVAVAAAFKLK